MAFRRWLWYDSIYLKMMYRHLKLFPMNHATFKASHFFFVESKFNCNVDKLSVNVLMKSYVLTHSSKRIISIVVFVVLFTLELSQVRIWQIFWQVAKRVYKALNRINFIFCATLIWLPKREERKNNDNFRRFLMN